MKRNYLPAGEMILRELVDGIVKRHDAHGRRTTVQMSKMPLSIFRAARHSREFSGPTRISKITAQVRPKFGNHETSSFGPSCTPNFSNDPISQTFANDLVARFSFPKTIPGKTKNFEQQSSRRSFRYARFLYSAR